MTRTIVRNLLYGLLLVLLVNGIALPQYRYRTFSQQNFAEKKAKPGKILRSQVTFTFHNATASVVNGLYARFNSEIIAFTDSGGFTSFDIGRKSKDFTAGGRTINPGDSVTVGMIVRKKSPGTIATKWWWRTDDSMTGAKHEALVPVVDQQVLTEPNGGYVLEYIYKRIITRPAGLIIGRPDTSDVGWIRYMKADRKYFPHTGQPRCLDYLVSGVGGQKAFIGEKKNLHVKRHDNHLLGELHLLKLAIIANDAGATEPVDTLAPLFGDLLYNDSSNSGDQFNGMTLRSIVHYADSAITYCANFTSEQYLTLDNLLSRVNGAFDGQYIARSVNPLVLAGTVDLSAVPFLRAVPGTSGHARTLRLNDPLTLEPEAFVLNQNYPNPFNPSTVISFTLPSAGFVRLTVYNLLGQEVATLIDGAWMDEGDDSIEFDAAGLSSGVYMYRLTVSAADGSTSSAARQMVLVR